LSTYDLDYRELGQIIPGRSNRDQRVFSLAMRGSCRPAASDHPDYGCSFGGAANPVHSHTGNTSVQVIWGTGDSYFDDESSLRSDRLSDYVSSDVNFTVFRIEGGGGILPTKSPCLLASEIVGFADHRISTDSLEELKGPSIPREMLTRRLLVHETNSKVLGNNTVCANGEVPVYYERTSTDPEAKDYVIYFGGSVTDSVSFCYDSSTCGDLSTSYISSINSSTISLPADGILSSVNNPGWGGARKAVYVPYCSADFLTGFDTDGGGTVGDVTLAGNSILRAIIDTVILGDVDYFESNSDEDGSNVLIIAEGESAVGVRADLPYLAGEIEPVKLSVALVGYENSQEIMEGVLSDPSVTFDTNYVLPVDHPCSQSKNRCCASSSCMDERFSIRDTIGTNSLVYLSRSPAPRTIGAERSIVRNFGSSPTALTTRQSLFEIGSADENWRVTSQILEAWRGGDANDFPLDRWEVKSVEARVEKDRQSREVNNPLGLDGEKETVDNARKWVSDFVLQMSHETKAKMELIQTGDFGGAAQNASGSHLLIQVQSILSDLEGREQGCLFADEQVIFGVRAGTKVRRRASRRSHP